MRLTEKQSAVLKAVQNASPGDFVVLRGFAGTGKSVTASEIIKSINQKTLIITPTAAALAVLKRKLDNQKIEKVDFKTIASLMSRHQTVLKFNNFKHFSPVIATREVVEEMNKFTSRNLQSVFEVQEEIASLNPSLTIEEVSDALNIKYATREREIELKNENQFRVFEMKMLNDPTFNTDNYILSIDTIRLSELMKKYFSLNPFDPIEEVSEFDFNAVEAVAAKISEYALVVIDEMSMMSEEQSTLYQSAIKICDDAPVTLVSGDAGQLEPVNGEFNDWCTMEDNGTNVFELTEILRSTDDIATFGQMIRLNVSLKTIADSDPRVKSYEKNTSINQIFTENERDFKESDIALAFTNKDVEELNKKIRYSKGLIGYVQPNDKIVVNRNTGYSFKSGILHANGQIYKVLRDLSDVFYATLEALRSLNNFSLDKIKLALKQKIIKFIEVEDDEESKKYILVSSNCYSLNSRELKDLDTTINKSLRNNLNFEEISQMNTFFSTLDIDNLQEFKFPNLVDVKFAHAMTVHKSQGSQFKNVIYVVSSKDLWIQSQDRKNSKFKQAPVYVAVTRAIENIKVFYIK